MPELKDPAVLFFPSDFLLETMFMTDAQVGKYMKVICGIFAHGHLSLNRIKAICGDDTETILELLATDENGSYYHVRLEYEMQSRATYRKSRSQNASGGKSEAKEEPKPKKSEIKKDNNEEKNTEEEMKADSKTKKRYGKDGIILLTDLEYKELRSVLGGALEKRIDEAGAYIKGNGKQYNSHFALLKSWVSYEKPPRVDNQSYDDILEMADFDIQSSVENGGAFVRKMKMDAS
ncbi:MAG: hypothetical protein IJ445_07270 [Clostridia bacterium]|nr:hypothetical protein [Clostridia bacterium]